MNWKAWRRRFKRLRRKWRALKDCSSSRIFIASTRRKSTELTDELEAAKENITKLYARWEELEAIKAAAERP